MTVQCEGDSRVMEQVGEKQDFEAELSRLHLRHEDFVLHVRRGRLGGLNKDWQSHYAVRVTHVMTGYRGIYLGGPGEDWVAAFASDVAQGKYRSPQIIPLRTPLRHGGERRQR